MMQVYPTPLLLALIRNALFLWLQHMLDRTHARAYAVLISRSKTFHHIGTGTEKVQSYNILKPKQNGHHSANDTLTLSQWSSNGNPVAIQCTWNLNPSVHWNATGERIVGSQGGSSVVPVWFQWLSSGLTSVFQLCKLTLDRHWNTTGCYHQPVWFQWHPSVLVAPVVFQCVPIMQIDTGSPLEHHWMLASASVVLVASQCTYGSSCLPVWSVQWYPSVLTESGLEVIRSGHFPACDPLCIQLVWWALFELNWFRLTSNPKYTKTIMAFISKACTEWCWSTHMC